MRQLRTFFITTYGCQMNELDSEVMTGLLKKRGLLLAQNEQSADLLIFNTCSIRDLAERKVLGKLGRMFRRSSQKPIIGITGCMANAKKEDLFKKFPELDFVLGTNNIHELNNILDEVLQKTEHQIRIDDRFSHELEYTSAYRDDPIKAYVSIIRGCNKYCTYCVVPYTRGPEVSRPPSDIIDECQRLINNGYREITLLGQNVNSYGKDHPEWKCAFHDLLAKLDALAKNKCRIRFMTSHPVDITDDVMQACRDLPSLCSFVHFPLQAGSNRILKKMNRRYSKEEYMEKVLRFRSYVPHIALGTDIIVGFPSETDAEFEETLKALETIRFAQAFLFSYSPRKGTPAMRLIDDVSKEKKEERLQTLIALQEKIYTEDRTRLINTTVEVLVEKPSLKNEALLKGRTSCWKNVVFPGPKEFVGTFQKVHIDSVANQTLLGKICAS